MGAPQTPPSSEVYVSSVDQSREEAESSESKSRSSDRHIEELVGSFDKLIFDGQFETTDSHLVAAASKRNQNELRLSARRPVFWQSPPV